jgi:very-short-patch-repair endonuclease
MTPHDLDLLWRAEALDGKDDPAAALFRYVLGMRVVGKRVEPNALVEWAYAELVGSDDAGVRLVSALAAVFPPAGLPAVLLAPSGADGSVYWLGNCARVLGTLVEAVPALAAAIAVTAEAVDPFLQQTPGSHWQALAREGLVLVQGFDGPELAQVLKAQGVDPAPLGASVKKLGTDGASEELAVSFAEAAKQVGRQETPEREEQARSAAERFLHDRLESLPQTAGLFALNQRLEFRHGRSAAEVDLLAADLKLVIELDGAYYHLGDQDAYRRDRRKDWLLQRHGYVVLRFLSDDVVRRLEEILETILTAVEMRRQLVRSEGQQRP